MAGCIFDIFARKRASAKSGPFAVDASLLTLEAGSLRLRCPLQACRAKRAEPPIVPRRGRLGSRPHPYQGCVLTTSVLCRVEVLFPEVPRSCRQNAGRAGAFRSVWGWLSARRDRRLDAATAPSLFARIQHGVLRGVFRGVYRVVSRGVCVCFARSFRVFYVCAPAAQRFLVNWRPERAISGCCWRPTYRPKALLLRSLSNCLAYMTRLC